MKFDHMLFYFSATERAVSILGIDYQEGVSSYSILLSSHPEGTVALEFRFDTNPARTVIFYGLKSSLCIFNPAYNNLSPFEFQPNRFSTYGVKK